MTRLRVLCWRLPARFHEINGSGTRLHSFAEVPVIAGLEPLGFFKSMAEQQLKSGIIACLEDPGLIVIRADGAAVRVRVPGHGTHVWTTTLTDYKQFEYETRAAGEVAAECRERGSRPQRAAGRAVVGDDGPGAIRVAHAKREVDA